MRWRTGPDLMMVHRYGDRPARFGTRRPMSAVTSRASVGYPAFGKPCELLRAVLPSAGAAGASIPEAEASTTAGGRMLRKLIVILGVAVAASPAATAWAGESPAAPSARTVIATPSGVQARGACSPGSPCAAVDCGPGRVCVPSPKQCFTTPCPQYDCVPASSIPGSDHRPPSPGRGRPRDPEQRPAYPHQRQTAGRSEKSPAGTPAHPARSIGLAVDLRP